MTPPPVAEMVKLEEPVVVEDAAVRVSLLAPLPGEAMLVGAKTAVTPLGKPVTESATAELNPLSTAVERVTEDEPPTATVELEALAVKLRLGWGTVNERAAVRVMPAPVPLRVICEEPTAAVELALNVAVTGVEAVRVCGEKATVTPEGRPLAESVTGELKPPCAVRVKVTLAELPRVTEAVEAFGVKVKLVEVTAVQLSTKR